MLYKFYNLKEKIKYMEENKNENIFNLYLKSEELAKQLIREMKQELLLMLEVE